MRIRAHVKEKKKMNEIERPHNDISDDGAIDETQGIQVCTVLQHSWQQFNSVEWKPVKMGRTHRESK